MKVNSSLEEALSEIVRVSRVLGADPALVLHGGGNTSIKARGIDVTGREVDLVLVKGSGWDLATIDKPGFAPLRRDRLLELLELDTLSDSVMVNELRQASLDAAAPTASIEALLHGYLPARVVLHSHADSIVALTNQPQGARRAAEVLGSGVRILPYVMPGFDLARMVSQADIEGIDAIVLSNHGLFTFHDDPDLALARHRELVDKASTALGITEWGASGPEVLRRGTAVEIAGLRAQIAKAAGRPMIVRQSAAQRGQDFASRDDLAAVTSRGTATPEHVIRTKRTPLVGTDVAAYVAEYQRYVQENRGAGEYVELDPAPRVVLDTDLGLLTVGSTIKAANAVHDIALHTMDIIDSADRDGGYISLNEAQSFEIEYWELEQARIRPTQSGRDLEGEVALVTGAASGIGRASAAELLARGAAVVGIDLNDSVATAFNDPAWRGVIGDVSDTAAIAEAIETSAREFGGLDMLVVSAGIFVESVPIAELDDGLWDRSFRVNTTAMARILREAHPLLVLSPKGGRVVLVSTKNVQAPGPGVAAYSASKAAAAQLARIAALEWASDGIRVNQVEPDAVFDTAIWTPELLAERAAHYGMTVQEYRTRNLLGVEVTSAIVAESVVALCRNFPATTGVRITVDGGNDRVI